MTASRDLSGIWIRASADAEVISIFLKTLSLISREEFEAKLVPKSSHSFV